MLQECYTNAIDRQKFVVLGLTLAPLSLYHCRVLDSINSPFINDGEGINDESLLTAASICMMKDKDSIIELMSGGYEKALGEMVAEIGEYDLQTECDTMAEYIRYYMTQPRRTKGKGSDGRIRAPWWGQAKSFLCDHSGYTNDEAWNCIVCEAYNEIAFVSARRDDETLMDEFSLGIEAAYESGEIKHRTQEEIKKEMGLA